ncbi:MAG: dienelactone hydrolase family protein [Bacteroidetes bacterium]|nr:dienelactone hydrolase family protein [Bacteroidota bacterium]
MKYKLSFLSFSAATIFLFSSCNNQESSSKESNTDSSGTTMVATPVLAEQNVTYSAGGVTMNGYVVYDSTKHGPRPAIIVIPEWWGLNDYPKMRARKLAELGYIAMAIDLYGDGKVADNPSKAQEYANPFYQDPQMAKTRFDAAMAKLKSYPEADTSNLAAIGYCFGGAQALNVAKLGENLKGIVSFHGNLIGTPVKKGLLKAKLLICHGADDKFVQSSEVDIFKKQMDSIGADYTVINYPGATHAFTNPAATDLGKKFNLPIAYNGAADTASWNDMKDFFGKLFK